MIPSHFFDDVDINNYFKNNNYMHTFNTIHNINTINIKKSGTTKQPHTTHRTRSSPPFPPTPLHHSGPQTHPNLPQCPGKPWATQRRGPRYTPHPREKYEKYLISAHVGHEIFVFFGFPFRVCPTCVPNQTSFQVQISYIFRGVGATTEVCAACCIIIIIVLVIIITIIIIIIIIIISSSSVSSPSS
jgi:hypothetical protein